MGKIDVKDRKLLRNEEVQENMKKISSAKSMTKAFFSSFSTTRDILAQTVAHPVMFRDIIRKESN